MSLPSQRNDVQPELLAPAGNWDCARAAVANGANAVYFGAPAFNARLRADNFSMDDLPRLVRFLHTNGLKAYATLNVLIFQNELRQAAELLDALASAGVDAVIMQDVGMARLAARSGLGVHASTQMTITSAEGVAFAKDLGVRRVVVARETSLKELARFSPPDSPDWLPLETFVHGALCVAYSGQCLTSEALGQRSANRGECAQACRMPYELMVDGELKDLGDKRYLLSPQDLAAVNEIPELIRLGVRSFKIEGRLKTPEYVAAVCRVYRKAIDEALALQGNSPTPEDQYNLEMSFSRGLFSGWMHGVNHQQLVHARFGKKRGAFVGHVVSTSRASVTLDSLTVPVKPGDGIVFDEGRDTENEIGGRVFSVRGASLTLDPDRVDLRRIPSGARVWKTNDPALDKELRAGFAGVKIDDRISLKLEVRFDEDGFLEVQGRTADAREVMVRSTMIAQPALRHPLTAQVLTEQLGRLGETPFRLEGLTFTPNPGQELMLPLSELGRLRRELVSALEAQPIEKSFIGNASCLLEEKLTTSQHDHLIPSLQNEGTQNIGKSKSRLGGMPMPRGIGILPMIQESPCNGIPNPEPAFSLLCRTQEQFETALVLGLETITLDFEDIRRFAPTIAAARSREDFPSATKIFVASPRIIKASEGGLLGLLEKSGADGFLVRNASAIARLKQSGRPLVGDFSLNISNALSAGVYQESGLTACAPSFDLNADQLCDLVASFDPRWFEVVIHQHIPMFHMEHCVFAAFMSEGTDHTNCGRPCEKHRVTLRDRVGQQHPLLADVGCRNTLFNGRAQSGASVFHRLWQLGVSRFRIDLLDESGNQVRQIVEAYRTLATGSISPEQLFDRVQAARQLGVTGGTLTVLNR